MCICVHIHTCVYVRVNTDAGRIQKGAGTFWHWRFGWCESTHFLLSAWRKSTYETQRFLKCGSVWYYYYWRGLLGLLELSTWSPLHYKTSPLSSEAVGHSSSCKVTCSLPGKWKTPESIGRRAMGRRAIGCAVGSGLRKVRKGLGLFLTFLDDLQKTYPTHLSRPCQSSSTLGGSHYPYFIEKEMEGRKGEVTLPRSYGRIFDLGHTSSFPNKAAE